MNAALPAFTAFKYGHFAYAPAGYDDEYSWSLITLFIAQFPLALLGAAFAGVSYIEGSTWRRVLVYLAIVAFFGVLSGLAKFAIDTELGPILAWAITLQLVLLMFVGPQPTLAIARIEAVTTDAVNVSILTVWGGLVAIVVALVFEQYAGNLRDWQPIRFEWSDVAWIGAVYFVLRAWSAAYVYTPAFEARGKGYFQRPWIEWLLRKRPLAESD